MKERKNTFLTGDLIPAKKAEEMGLINHAVQLDQLDERVDTFSKRLGGGALKAIKWTKISVNIGLNQLAHSIIDGCIAYEARCNRTEDHAEAVAAAEFAPLHDTMIAAAHARAKGMWVVGPNTVGISAPGKAMLVAGAAEGEITRAEAQAAFRSRGGECVTELAELSSPTPWPRSIEYRDRCNDTAKVSADGDSNTEKVV